MSFFKSLKNYVQKYKYIIFITFVLVLILVIFVVKREKYQKICNKGYKSFDVLLNEPPFDDTFSKRDFTDKYMSNVVDGNPTVLINKNQDRDLLSYYGDLAFGAAPLGDQDKWIFMKEGFSNVPNVFVADDTNFRNWPYYYYSNPNPGGSFPPDMLSKLRQIEPGFEPNGLSYELRPGIKYRDWPANRWFRSSGSYNYMNNL